MKIFYSCIGVGVVSAILALATFIYANQPFMDALALSLLFSIPFAIMAFLFYRFKQNQLGFKNSVLYSILLFSFIFISVLYLAFNTFMFISVFQQQSLGPAQGYWLLILVGSTIKAVLYGAITGLVLHFGYKLWSKAQSKNDIQNTNT